MNKDGVWLIQTPSLFNIQYHCKNAVLLHVGYIFVNAELYVVFKHLNGKDTI